jgi:hypothetical protein
MATTKLLGITKMESTTADKVTNINDAIQALENGICEGVEEVNVETTQNLIGELVLGTSDLNQVSQEIYTNKYDLPAGDVLGMQIYIRSSSGSVSRSVMLYDDSSGQPGNILKQETDTFDLTGSGWKELLFGVAESISKGTYHIGMYNSTSTIFGEWKTGQQANVFYFDQGGLTHPTAPDPATPSGTNTNRPPFRVVMAGPLTGDVYVGSGFKVADKPIIRLTGALSSSITLVMPQRIGVWLIINETTGNYNVRVRVSDDYSRGAYPGSGFSVKQGEGVWCFSDNLTDIYPLDPTAATKV